MSGTLLRAFAKTPLRDIVRGRLTGRLDMAAVIASHSLPDPLPTFVTMVTRKTRLWRLEKADVARELCAHFQDGVAAGRTSQQLIADFGDAQTAANLIRRAKKRSRHWAWRSALRTAQAFGLLVAILVLAYGVSAARVFSASPVLAHNYTKEFNDKFAALPDDHLAWPLYRKAAFTLPVFPKALAENFPAIDPDSPQWGAATEYMRAAEPALAFIRKGSARPTLGFPQTDANDAEMERNNVRVSSQVRPEGAAYEPVQERATENPMLLGVLLPNLGVMRNFARHLSLDAAVAQSEGDAARVVSDIQALLGMAGQLHGDGMLIEQMVSFAIFQVAIETAADALRDSPALLSDAQWVQVAHGLAAWGGGGEASISMTAERQILLDLAQRLYSDDGRGDGHLTVEGVQLLNSLTGSNNPLSEAKATVGSRLVAPVAAAVVAGRRDMVRMYDRCMDSEVRFASLPFYEQDLGGHDSEIELLSQSMTQKVKYIPVSVMLPAVQRCCAAPRRVGMFRDGVVTVSYTHLTLPTNREV